MIAGSQITKPEITLPSRINTRFIRLKVSDIFGEQEATLAGLDIVGAYQNLIGSDDDLLGMLHPGNRRSVG